MNDPVNRIDPTGQLSLSSESGYSGGWPSGGSVYEPIYGSSIVIVVWTVHASPGFSTASRHDRPPSRIAAESSTFSQPVQPGREASQTAQPLDERVEDAVLLARGALLLRETFERQSPDDFRSSFPEIRNRSDEDVEFIKFGFIDSLTNIARVNFDIATRGGALQGIEAVNREVIEGLTSKGLPRKVRRILDVAKRTLGIKTDAGIIKAAQFTCDPGTGSCSGEIVTRVVR